MFGCLFLFYLVCVVSWVVSIVSFGLLCLFAVVFVACCYVWFVLCCFGLVGVVCCFVLV